MLKMVDGTGIIGVDMVCPLGGTVSPPQPPNYDNIEMEGVGSLVLANSLKAPLERVELIGNSVQGENPSPDNLQEIKSVGRKSKNLLNLQKQPDVKETYLGWKVSNGEKIVLSVTDKGNNADITGCYLGLSKTGGSLDGVVWVVNNGANVIKEIVDTNQYVSVYPPNETTVQKLLNRFDIQVEYGGNATNYEPYGYLLDVKVTGKNLFDLTKIKNGFVESAKNGFNVVQDNRYPSSIYLDMIIPLKAGQTLNISGVTPDTCRIRVKYDTGVYYLKYTANKDTEIIICFYGGLSEDDKRNLMIEISDELTPYEPYTEQTVQIALDEPLRGIGEYKDVLTKDGVVRKIYEQTLKKERISMNEYNWDRKFFRLYVNSDKKIDSSTTITRLFSNMFKGFAIYKGNPTIYWLISEEEIRSMSVTEADSREVAYEKIKDFVTNNDIVVQYPIAETTLEPLPESVQAQLQALHSENGTTHVFVDSGEVEAGIKLTYRKEK